VKENILTALKTKYKNLGFGDKAFDGVADYLSITVTEESQLETAIGGVEPLLKAFQGDIDKRVTDAVAKKERELKAAQTPATPPTPPAQPANQQDEVPAWAKAMMQKLETFERKETQAALTAKLKAKIGDAVPESFLNGRQINIESESEIDTLAPAIVAQWTAVKQDLINQGVLIENPKQGQNNPRAGVEHAIQAAERRNKNSNPDNPTPGLLDNL
jgi:hypothetical protein